MKKLYEINERLINGHLAVDLTKHRYQFITFMNLAWLELQGYPRADILLDIAHY